METIKSQGKPSGLKRLLTVILLKNTYKGWKTNLSMVILAQSILLQEEVGWQIHRIGGIKPFNQYSVNEIYNQYQPNLKATP